MNKLRLIVNRRCKLGVDIIDIVRARRRRFIGEAVVEVEQVGIHLTETLKPRFEPDANFKRFGRVKVNAGDTAGRFTAQT
ncbi:MAG TPA: hypothetical protein VG326_03955 [Tepidisphaeraceae bacterium]|nr:hypothetical protein [Tepidisphaeraceae bacterium]